MRRLIIAVVLSVVFFLTISDIYANSIGIKGGYAKMMDDYSDFDDTLAFGLFFDVGKFLIKPMKFRPGLDYVPADELDVFGLHADWYWFFLNERTEFKPFIGFGPALNYINIDSERTDDQDTDVGFELFAGFDYDFSGPLSMMIELRFLIHDISDAGTRVLKANIGLSHTI